MSVVDGYVVIEVFPVVGAALAELQSMGILPADIQLPDLSNPEAPGVLAGRLETALGVTLPETFGTIQLMPADRLLTARTVVRVLDLAVILLIVLSFLLVALAIWLARDRRRMLIYVAIGTIIAFLLARLAINAGVNAIIGGIADEGLAGAVRSVVDATVADLRGLTTVILIATGIVAIAAYLAGRPAWLNAAGSKASATAGQAGSVAMAMGSDGVAAAGARRPTRDTLETTLRDNRQAVERIGIGVIVFIVAWIALGIEVALVGAALVDRLRADPAGAVLGRGLSQDPTSYGAASPSYWLNVAERGYRTRCCRTRRCPRPARWPATASRAPRCRPGRRSRT